MNYRGSTGYGSAWRDALTGRPGLTELEDVGAVYDALVAEGVVDPQRALITGGSWGGFLTLLGLGTQPERWAAGIAEVPVADYLAAYEDEMEGLRAYDRALFGGSPEEVHDVYVRSSPLTYVDAVAAPVLVVAGANDPRCPIRQIDNYLGELEKLGKDVRGLPVRRRPRLAGHRGDDPPGRGRPGLRLQARHALRWAGSVLPHLSTGRRTISGTLERDENELRDLDRVEGGTLAQVVVADEQRQPAAVVDARVLADPAT